MPNQNNDEFCPDWASPPGDTIQYIIEERELLVVELAEQLGLTLHEMQRLLVGRKQIDTVLAGKISSVLGSTAGFWLKREEQYREDLKRLDLDN